MTAKLMVTREMAETLRIWGEGAAPGPTREQTVKALLRRGLLDEQPDKPGLLRISDAGLRELARWSRVEVRTREGRARLRAALARRYPTVAIETRLYAAGEGDTGWVSITCDDHRVHAFAAGFAAALDVPS